jgi:hypothetical protein
MSEAWSMRLGATCRMAAIGISVLAGNCSPRRHGPAPTLGPPDRACTTNIISSSKMSRKERNVFLFRRHTYVRSDFSAHEPE